MQKPLADDLMLGVERIANHIGQTERWTFHMLATGQLPGFKLGAKWAARQSTLERYIAEQELAALTEREEQAARATARTTTAA